LTSKSILNYHFIRRYIVWVTEKSSWIDYKYIFKKSMLFQSFFMAFEFSWNKLTSIGQNRGWCSPLCSSLSCSPWNFPMTVYYIGRGSSVSTVSDYGPDDRAIGVRSPAEAKDFPSNLCVQTGSGAHPASYTKGTGGPFPGVKRGEGMTLTTHPHLVPRSGMSRSYIPLPKAPSWRVLCFALLCFAFVYYKEKVESIGNKSCSHFRKLWSGKLADKRFRTQASFEHI
jgi:hypothetical protein